MHCALASKAPRADVVDYLTQQAVQQVPLSSRTSTWLPMLLSGIPDALLATYAGQLRRWCSAVGAPARVPSGIQVQPRDSTIRTLRSGTCRQPCELVMTCGVAGTIMVPVQQSVLCLCWGGGQSAPFVWPPLVSVVCWGFGLGGQLLAAKGVLPSVS
jgi:hypothetical protein